MRSIAILLLAACLSGCKEDPLKVITSKTVDFYIADTCVKAVQFLAIDKYYSDYPIYYIGHRSDTIKIGKRYWRGCTPWVDNFLLPCNWQYSDKTLSIIVDTSIKTNSPVEYFSDDPQIVKDSTINYHSFLLTIRNISDSLIYMGRTFSLFLIHREAKNKNGEWIKIDKNLREIGICGTGEPTIILKPNEIIVSKVKRYKGDFVTDFRLVFGYGDNVVYSNIFKDSIDQRTLDNQIGE